MFSGLSLPLQAISVYRPTQANPVASFGPDAELDAIRAELAQRRMFGEFILRPRTARGVEDSPRELCIVSQEEPDDEPDDLERVWEASVQSRFERAAEKEIEASEHRATARSAQRIAQAEAEAAALRVRVEMLDAERAEWRAQAESTVERLTRRIERERDEAEHAQKRAHEQELRRMERALETARTEAEEQARAAKFRSQMELEYLTREVTELRELKRTLTAAVDSERAERYAERLRAQEEIAKARGEITRARAQSESAQQLDVVRGMAGLLKEADPDIRPMLTQSFGAQLGVPVHEPTVVERLISEVGKNPELIEPVFAWVRDRVFGAPSQTPGVNIAAIPSKRL